MQSAKSKLNMAIKFLNPKISHLFYQMSDEDKAKINEIRLRNGRYLTVSVLANEFYITGKGKMSDNSCNAVLITAEDIDYTYKTALRNTIYSFKREISQGYIITEGGNRVGFCGTAVLDEYGKNETLKNISSVSIRIAREAIGSSNELIDKLHLNDELKNVLILGPRSSG